MGDKTTHCVKSVERHLRRGAKTGPSQIRILAAPSLVKGEATMKSTCPGENIKKHGLVWLCCDARKDSCKGLNIITDGRNVEMYICQAPSQDRTEGANIMTRSFEHPIIGQEIVCPDGLGRVVDYEDRFPNCWIKVETYINNRGCRWAPENVVLVNLATADASGFGPSQAPSDKRPKGEQHMPYKERLLKEWPNGDKEWWIDDKRHRENNLPAVEKANGDKEWWVNGKRYRDNNLPTIERADGSKEW